MTSMVEKVARAIYEEDDVWSAAFPWPNMPSSDQSADNYRRIARAAIQAMREMTPGMIDASSYATTIGDEGVYRIGIDKQGALEVWEAAIDAALKEE
jgi:hypothetical protein